MGGPDATFRFLSLDIQPNTECAPSRQEWRRSTVSVLVDGIDGAVLLTRETGWSCTIRIGFVWQRSVRPRADRRRRRYLNYLFVFCRGILIEGIHRPGEMGPHAIPHAFDIYATDMTRWLRRDDRIADEYYIQFTVNSFDTPLPSDPITKACCDSALDVCRICMEEKRDRVCFSCGHTLCIDCMNKMWNEIDFSGYRCPMCPTDFDEPSFYSPFTVESDCPQG